MRVATTPPPTQTLYVRNLYAAVERAGADVEVLTIRRLLAERFDIVHLHWPEWQLRTTPYPAMARRSMLFLLALAASRLRGARLIWTVHNLEPHESTPPRATRLFFALLTSMVDGVISPSVAGVESLRRAFPRLAGSPTAVIPIGHLCGEYPENTTRERARGALGLEDSDRVALFFGLVRAYKGVETLAARFSDLDADDLALLIVGRPADDRVSLGLEQVTENDQRVRLRLGHVPDDEVAGFFLAADLVVLPYRQSTNSFVALLALSLDRPILAPTIGGFPELQQEFGPQWVRLYDGDLTATALDTALRAAADPPTTPPDLARLDWDRIGATTVAFYRRLRPTAR